MHRWMWVSMAAGGCATEVEQSPFETANLEPARVTLGQEVDDRLDVLGTLTVVPDGSGYALEVANPSATYFLELVSRGGGDLTVFDGRQVRLALSRISGTTDYSVALWTPEGEVLYLLEPRMPGQLTEAGFGYGLLGGGNDLGPVRRGGLEVELRSALLRTDGNEIELLPGEPLGVFLRGNEYRVVLMEAWEVTATGENCDVSGSRLAYEVIRVESGPVDEVPRQRSPDVPLLGDSCEDR